MRKIWILAALLVCIGTAGCKKKEGCTDPNATNFDVEAEVDNGSCTYTASTLSLQVTHKVGTEPFAFNTTYQDSTGRDYFFSVARFFISSPALITSSGTVPLNKYIQIVGGVNDYTIGTVEPGNYQGISFDVGVDSAANHSDPTLFPDDHPLSLMNPMQDHWAWNVGYVFLKIEGRVDTTAGMTGPINKFMFYHIATDSLLTHVTLPKNFTIEQGKDYTFQMTVDWGRALSRVDITRETTQTMDNVPLAQQIMNDLVSGIDAN